MIRGSLVIGRRVIIVSDAEVSPGLEPEIIGQTRVKARGIVILRAIRSHGQQSAIEIRRVPATFETGPIMIFQYDDEHRLDRRHSRKPRVCRQKEEQAKKFHHRQISKAPRTVKRVSGS